MNQDFVFEPERYELSEAARYAFEVNRRDFLKIAGGGIAVCLISGAAVAQETAANVKYSVVPPTPEVVSAWIHINEAGRLTVYTGKVEIGQNIRTSLSQAVGDELSVPPQSIAMVMGDTDLVPFEPMGTVGSRSTPTMAPQLRKAAAALRELLLQVAAERWKVDKSQLRLAQGTVTDATGGRSASFAELSRGQQLVKPIAENQATNPAEKWQIAGKPLRKLDGDKIVTGQTRFISDLKRPNLQYGKIIRPAAMGATLVSVDDRAARKIPGVTVVRDGNFLGVAAPKPWLARQAAEAIKAEWKTVPQPASSQDIYAFLKAHGEVKPAPAALEQALKQAPHKLSQSYTVAYIAHTPLEPRAAIAEWNGDKLTVWTGTQRPFGVREEVAQAFHMPASNVHLMVPPFGSAYGGKHTGECALEAARLAKATGRPVKVVWTREEEFQWAYFRPAGVIDIRSGMESDGRLSAWHHVNYHSGKSSIETIYDVPHAATEYVRSEFVLRTGSYRSLGAAANNFARETHMDELAHMAGIDPLEFRLKNLKDERARAVLEAAAERFQWHSRPLPGRGHGIAVGYDKGSYVATCAEIAMNSPDDEPKVLRVVQAFECGAIVNPDGLNNQATGAILLGLGGALFEAIDFANGRVLNGKLSQYRVPRFSDAPKIELVLLDRKDIPSAGAGETPLIGIAPAVGNAMFAATGVRRRSLPLARNARQIETTRA